MVRVLTKSQETIDDLLTNGAMIYWKRHRVEPSQTTQPQPIRCEKCQTYNEHTTAKCTKQPKCGFCAGPHNTRQCTNLQEQPKCSQCNEPHPTYSYKCKAKPAPEEQKPHLVVPVRTHEKTDQTTSTSAQPTSIYQPVTIEQMLGFITMALQNIHPFLRPHILQQVQYAAKSILQVNFNATYSGPYVHFHASHYETTV